MAEAGFLTVKILLKNIKTFAAIRKLTVKANELVSLLYKELNDCFFLLKSNNIRLVLQIAGITTALCCLLFSNLC